MSWDSTPGHYREVKGGLREVGGFAEVAPVEFVRAEGENLFVLGGEAEVRGDDGENALFGDHREEARGNDVDTGEGEGLQIRRGADDFGFLTTDAAA